MITVPTITIGSDFDGTHADGHAALDVGGAGR
jgi:hypothetical protein